jgi:serine/threonine protein kinase/Flp pilus assembly protein TadD
MTAATAQAKSIFLHAVEIVPGEQRRAYVDTACGNDAGLRREVEELLRHHGGLGAFLEVPACDAVTGGRVTTGIPEAIEGPGMAVGSYKLLEQIGEGGFGVVFMAEQQEPIRRKVALKVLKPGMDTKQVIARFEAERQALALMDHPNIAKVLDAGQTSSGRPYFVMDLVKGLPITDFCDQNQLTPRERLELFVSVCQAVQHAHQKGIIHRDLKPSNVLVTLHDGTPVVKVIDFGIAKALGQQLTDRTLFTGFAQMIGTPLYMSPEQAALSNLDVDTRSDVYSLGVLLYELLTGTTPFTKEQLQQAGYDEMRRIIREEEPPRPSTRISTLGQAATTISTQRKSDPKQLSRLFRAELDWIVMKALEKDRNRRFESANGLARDIDRYLRDEPVQACPPSAWYRAGKFARRNKVGLAVAGGMFLAVTMIAATVGWAVRDRAAREAAIEHREVARRAALALQVGDALKLARALVAQNKLHAARQKLAEARAHVGNDRLVLGNLAEEVEAGEAELGRFQRFRDLIERSYRVAMPSADVGLVASGSHGRPKALPTAPNKEGRPEHTVTLILQALQQYDVLGREDWNTNLGGSLLASEQVEQIRPTVYEELLKLVFLVITYRQDHRSGQKLSPEAAARQALGYLVKAETAHPPTQAFYVLRGRCRKVLGEAAAAQADQKRAFQTAPMMAVDHLVRGRAAFDAKRLSEAVQACEAALRLEPTRYEALLLLGVFLSVLGRGPEELAEATRVFTGCILRRPEDAFAYVGRAFAYSKLGRYKDALADSSRAIELDPQYGEARKQRGIAYFSLGKPNEALADFSQAIQLDPRLVSAWTSRGAIFCDHLGQYDKAVADFSRAIELDPGYVRAWYNRGNAHRKRGHYEEAVADYSTAVKLDPQHADAWGARGVAYLNLGQLEKAVLDLSKSIELAPNHPRLALIYLMRAGGNGRLARFAPARTDYESALKLAPTNARVLNGLAWLLAACPEPKVRDPRRAVELARKAVEVAPKEGSCWNTLGVAHYRTGDWKAAVTALEKSVAFSMGGDAVDHLFLAMAHWQLGDRDEARKSYAQAVGWLEKNKRTLENNKPALEEIRRFRSEAEEVLELKKK